MTTRTRTRAACRWITTGGPGGHNLKALLDLERGTKRLGTADWEDRFVVLLDRAWEAGRYPVDRKGEALFNDLCCVSALALNEAASRFVGIVATA